MLIATLYHQHHLSIHRVSTSREEEEANVVPCGEGMGPDGTAATFTGVGVADLRVTVIT
jgi:hypothetical protein